MIFAPDSRRLKVAKGGVNDAGELSFFVRKGLCRCFFEETRSLLPAKSGVVTGCEAGSFGEVVDNKLTEVRPARDTPCGVGIYDR